jgi:hypothetical protein
VDAHAARRDRPCGRPRDGVQPQRLRRAALGRAGEERRGFDLQALRAGSAAREDEQIPRLVPRAAPAAARLAVGACSWPRARLLDPEELRRRSIQQAVFARARWSTSNHRPPVTRTTTYSTASGAIRLFHARPQWIKCSVGRNSKRTSGISHDLCPFDRRDHFAARLLDPEELRRRSIQQAVFARARWSTSNHPSPVTRTTTYSTASGAIRLFHARPQWIKCSVGRNSKRTSGISHDLCPFDRRDHFTKLDPAEFPDVRNQTGAARPSVSAQDDGRRAGTSDSASSN